MTTFRALLSAQTSLLLLLAVVCGSFSFPTRDEDASSEGKRVRRVAGGIKVSAAVVPYQVRIDYPDALCGGTLIHPSYVLTAKHCIKGRDPKSARVSAGAPSGSGRPEETRMVRRVLPFPDKKQAAERRRWLPADLDPQAVMGDVALVQVDPPFPLDRPGEITPVGLRKGRGFEGQRCVLSGWGTTTMSDQSPARLRAAQVEVFSRAKCLNLEKRIKDDFICAGLRGGGVDACGGDSGGPLVCDGLLTGVVKGGRGCGESQHVTKYSEVALYARWVAHEVGLSEMSQGYAWHEVSTADASALHSKRTSDNASRRHGTHGRRR